MLYRDNGTVIMHNFKMECNDGERGVEKWFDNKKFIAYFKDYEVVEISDVLHAIIDADLKLATIISLFITEKDLRDFSINCARRAMRVSGFENDLSEILFNVVRMYAERRVPYDYLEQSRRCFEADASPRLLMSLAKSDAILSIESCAKKSPRSAAWFAAMSEREAVLHMLYKSEKDREYAFGKVVDLQFEQVLATIQPKKGLPEL